MEHEYRKGVLAALACMTLWGVLPIYWKLLIPISSSVIIIYRIVLVFVSALGLAKIKYGWSRIFSPLRERGVALKYFCAGAVITLNWSTYIWAVNAGYVVQSSIGYYIEPLVVCLFGVVLFHEKLTVYKGAALALAAISVAIILIHFGRLPGIALALAITFSVYAAIKSTVKQPPLISLVYETMFFAPIALGVVVFLERHGKGALGVGEPYQYVLLLLCGFMTVIPLALFAYAAQKTSMFVLGLAEYISPTLMLTVGVLIYREKVDAVQFLAFAVIWCGLAVFSYGEWAAYRKKEAARGE